MVAQQERGAQGDQPVMDGAALRAEVDMVAEGDDVAACPGGGMGQNGLQRGEVTVDVCEDQGLQGARLLSGAVGQVYTVTPG